MHIAKYFVHFCVNFQFFQCPSEFCGAQPPPTLRQDRLTHDSATLSCHMNSCSEHDMLHCHGVGLGLCKLLRRLPKHLVPRYTVCHLRWLARRRGGNLRAVARANFVPFCSTSIFLWGFAQKSIPLLQRSPLQMMKTQRRKQGARLALTRLRWPEYCPLVDAQTNYSIRQNKTCVPL